jgi:hypothetical protein
MVIGNRKRRSVVDIYFLHCGFKVRFALKIYPEKFV